MDRTSGLDKRLGGLRTVLRGLATAILLGLIGLGTSTGAQAQSACSVSSGVVTYPTGNACFAEPDFLTLTVYEAALCTSAPTLPTSTTTLDTSTCQVTFSNSTGSTISVATGASTSLSGTFTTPPAGTYTHGYIIVDNSFAVTANVNFGTTSATGETGGTGPFCATTSGSTATNNTSVCGTSAPSASAVSDSVTDFDGGSSAFANTASESFTTSSGTVTLDAALVNSSGTLSSGTASVSRIVAVQTFASSVVVPSTGLSSMNLAFNTSAGMTIVDNGTSVQLLSGPFRVVISTTP